MKDTDPNLEFRKKLDGGKSPLRILLYKKGTAPTTGQPSETSGRSRRQAIIPARRPADRIYLRSADIYLNFWDLGQITDGAGGWDDIDFSIAKSITTLSGTHGEPYRADNLNLTDWTALKDKIFEVSIENWATSYRQLTFADAYRYGLDMYFGDFAGVDAVNKPNHLDMNKYYPVASAGQRPFADYWLQAEEATFVEKGWTEQGLKVPRGMQYLNFISFNAFNNIGGQFTPKITATLDFSDPDVSFGLTKNTDFFLVPGMVGEIGVSAWDETTPGSFNSNSYLNILYKPLSRENFLDNEFIEDHENLSFGTVGSDGVPVMAKYDEIRTFTNGSSAVFPFSDLLADQIADPNSRAWYSEMGGPDTGTMGSAAGWFNGYTYLVSMGPFIDFLDESEVGDYNRPIVPVGALLAVAKQGENYFYFWNNGTETINSQYDLGTATQYIFLEFQKYDI